MIENSRNIAEGLAVSFFGYLENAAKDHETILEKFEREDELCQENNIVLRSLFVIFPFSEENRCIIKTLRRMEKNEDEDFIVLETLKNEYINKQGKLIYTMTPFLSYIFVKVIRESPTET